MAHELCDLGRLLRHTLWSEEPAAARIRLSGVEIVWLPEPDPQPHTGVIPRAIARYKKG